MKSNDNLKMGNIKNIFTLETKIMVDVFNSRRYVLDLNKKLGEVD